MAKLRSRARAPARAREFCWIEHEHDDELEHDSPNFGIWTKITGERPVPREAIYI